MRHFIPARFAPGRSDDSPHVADTVLADGLTPEIHRLATGDDGLYFALYQPSRCYISLQ